MKLIGVDLVIVANFLIGCVSVNTKMNNKLNEVYTGMTISEFKDKMEIPLKETPIFRTKLTPHFHLPFLVKSKSVFSFIGLS